LLLAPSKLKFNYKGIFFYDEDIDKEWKCFVYYFFIELKLLLLLVFKLLFYKREGDYKFLVEDLLMLLLILLVVVGLYIFMTSMGVGYEYFFDISFELKIFF